MTARQLAAEINKVLGKDTLRMGNDPYSKTRITPTDVLPIDDLLQGGIPYGRMTELYGAFSTLKSYIGLKTIARVQQDGGVAALVDTEHAFDPEWAALCGVNVDELLLEHPATGEEAVDVTEAMVRLGAGLVVWDSVAATLPQDEQGKRMKGERMQPARLAALMSAALRRLTAANSNTTAFLWINQTRLNVGQTFGNPEVTPGGRALPFYASHRVSLHRAGYQREDTRTYDPDGKEITVKQTVAYRVRATLEKSKLTVPHKDVIFTFDLRTGAVDEVGYLIQLAMAKGIVTKQGAMWTYKGTSKRGKDAFRAWMESNPKMVQDLQASCRGSHAPGKKTVGSVKRLPPRKKA